MVARNNGYIEGRNSNGVYFHTSRNIIWKVAVYIRLSVADGNEVSLSVKNQEAIIMDYMENEFNEPYIIHKVYIDDGISGTTNNERDSFQGMIDDIESGEVNCVVSKMLSRVFRNYADQGYFLEEYFPRMGIRFITIDSPKVDTYKNPSAVHGYELPLNGIVNDRIAESTSRAVRQTFKNMRKNGKFQGGFPPYGYIRDPEDKYSFIVDSDAAEIVKMIFKWYGKDLMHIEEIRRRLNEMEVLTPTLYKQSKGYKYNNPSISKSSCTGWTGTTIKRILTNRTYLGEMVQGRSTIISYKVHKQIAVPEENWETVADRHEALVDEETFNFVQKRLERNKSYRSYGNTPSLFSGIVYCADCNRKMHKRRSDGREYYACSTYYKGNKDECSSHFISVKKIEQAVLKAIQIQISLVDINKITENAEKEILRQMAGDSVRNKLIENKEAELEKINKRIKRLYMDYCDRIISRNEYEAYKLEFTEKKEAIEKQLKEINGDKFERADKERRRLEYVNKIKEYNNIKELDRKILEELVEKIYIDAEKNITIQFKYEDIFREYMQ